MAKNNNNIHKTEGLRGSDSYHNSINYIYIIHYTLLIYKDLSSCFSLSSVSSANCIIIFFLGESSTANTSFGKYSTHTDQPASSMFSDDTRYRQQQYVVKEAAKENHSNCTKPLNLIAFLHISTHEISCFVHQTTQVTKFVYTRANEADDEKQAALSRPSPFQACD